MKKLLILLMLFSFGVGLNVGSKAKVNADYMDAYCGSVSYEGTYVLKISYEWPLGVESVVFTVPDSEYHLLESGVQEYRILFYSRDTGGSLVLIDTLIYEDNFGSHKATTIDIDLSAYGLEDAVVMDIMIPQSYTIQSGGTPAGYTDSICASFDTDISIYYTTPEYRDIYYLLDLNVDYAGLDFDWLRSDYVNIYGGMASLKLGLRYLDDYPINYYIESPDAYIEYFNSSYTLLDTVYLKNIETFIATLDPIDFIDLGLFAYNDLTYFKLHLPVDNIFSYNEIDYANRYTYIDDERDSFTVRYYYDGELIESGIGYIGYPLSDAYTFADGYVTGYVFRMWLLSSAAEFYGDEVITEDMLEGGVLNLYSTFIPITDNIDDLGPGDTIASDTTILSLFTNLGARDPISRTVISVILIIAVTVGLYFLKVGDMAIYIVDSILVLFLIYIGLVPAFVSVTLFVILIYLAWNGLSRGGNTNE